MYLWKRNEKEKGPSAWRVVALLVGLAAVFISIWRAVLHKGAREKEPEEATERIPMAEEEKKTLTLTPESTEEIGDEGKEPSPTVDDAASEAEMEAPSS
jgi:hypothetical protein